MYSSSSLRSRCSRHKKSNGSKDHRRSESTFFEDEIPYSLSTWNSQISLHSTLGRNAIIPLKPYSLFHHNSIGASSVGSRGKKRGGFIDDLNTECQERSGKMVIRVHNADWTYRSVLIDESMRVGQVCEVMLEKNHQNEMQTQHGSWRGSVVHWQIYEEPGDFQGFERQVEDHEFAMDLQRRWPAATAPSRIWFRYNRSKYAFSGDRGHNLLRIDAGEVFQSPPFPGLTEGIVLLKRPEGKWTKAFCFLVMSSLFFTKKTLNPTKKKAKYLLDLTSMDVYVPQADTDVTDIINSPTPHTLILVPSSIGLLDPDAVFAIGVKTREAMLAWAEGLRFYKHGQRRLAENLDDALNDRFKPSVEVETQAEVVQHENIPSPEVIPKVEEAPKTTPRSFESPVVNEAPRLYKQHRPQHFFPDDNVFREDSHKRIDAYNGFEGIVFRCGEPYLVIDLPTGIRRIPIEVSLIRGFDEKRYKLPFRKERFETLSDLSRFYEQRRYLLSDRDIDFHGHSASSPLAESSTAF